MSNEAPNQPGPSGLGQARNDEDTDDDENEEDLEDELMRSLPRAAPLPTQGGLLHSVPPAQVLQPPSVPAALPGLDPNIQLQNLQMQQLQQQHQQQQQMIQQHHQQSAAMSNPFMPGMQGIGQIRVFLHC